PEPRARGIAVDDRQNGALERGPILRPQYCELRQCGLWMADGLSLCTFDQLARRDDKPERRVDGIELRRITGVGEPVRQHAFGYGAGPLDEDIARVAQTAGR